MAELLIQYGKLQGRKLSLPDGEIVVGRDEGCQIRMASSEISRRHCVLRSSSVGIVVKDLESRNGTFVNDVAVEGEVTLKPGDVLKIGPIVFQVPPVSVPASESSPADAGPRPKKSSPSFPTEPRPTESHGVGARAAAVGKTAARKPVKKASDDDIADWLSGEDPDDSVSPGDTTIIPGRPSTAAAPVQEPPHEPKVERKAFRTVREEAADIIRRHHEQLRKKREAE